LSEVVIPAPSKEDLIEIGPVVGPHGIRGELKIWVPDPSSSSLLKAKSIYLRHDSGECLEFVVLGARPAKSVVLIKLSGIKDRTAAEAFCGWKACLTNGDMLPLEKNEYYLFQLKGMSVHDPAGRILGKISALSSNNAQDLLVIESADGSEKLVPFVSGIVKEIRLSEKILVIENIEGLLD